MIKFENPINGRFYYLKVHTDLLNHKVLTIIRGGKNISVTIHKGFDCDIEIDKEIHRLCLLRLKRGYICKSKIVQ